VFNVTSDTAASVSFQAAQPKPARPDPSQLNDSFGALVDSSLPPDTSAAPAAPQRRAGDTTASQDNSRPRDTTADQTAPNASDDHNANAQQASDASAAANANTAPAPRSKAKSDSSKDSSAKATDKPSSDKVSATDQAAPAQQGTASVTTPNPVAVAIQVTVASTDVAAAPPATGNSTAPLAIAAAAIAAASAPAAAAQAASSAQIKSGSGAAASAAASAADGASTAANAAAAATSAKSVVQTAATTTVAMTAKQPATPADATTAADTGLSAAIAAAAPVAPKTTSLKTPGTVQAKGTAPSDTKSAKSDPATTDTLGSTLQANTTQAAANAKPQAGADGADAAKAEANAASTSVATASAHNHAPVNATAAQTAADALDAGSQVAGAIQPQLPAPVATAPALSVTAATNTPVPLSGLAVEIAASATAGKSHFEIRLDPADLGRIDVRIDVDRNGQVTSHLTVEKPETLSMLRQDAPQLQQALDDAGFKTGDGGLQFSLRDQSSSGQNSGNESGRNAQRLVISEDDTIPAVTAGRTYGRMLGSSSGVDIRV
jgi:flagellar hook-length control protein FliK